MSAMLSGCDARRSDPTRPHVASDTPPTARRAAQLVLLIAAMLLPAAGAASAQADNADAQANHANPEPRLHMISTDIAGPATRWLVEQGADRHSVREGQVYWLVPPGQAKALRQQELPFEMIHEDVDAAYTNWKASLPPVNKQSDFSEYHDLAETEAFIFDLVDRFPEHAALEVIGQSVEGRDIYALRISSDPETVDHDKPAYLSIGCHHSREWISVEVNLYLAEYLLENYRKDGRCTRLIDNTEQWFVPVLNPDGFHYSWTTDRWWRKNRRDNGDGTFGVDPNRNYSYQWGGEGASDDSFSDTYRGPEAFSEPETRSIRDLMTTLFDGRTFEMAVSYHNYSQLIIYPWGWTTEPTEDDAEFERIASGMADLINASHDSPLYDYGYGQGSLGLYVTSGDFTDWAYGELGVLAYTIEVRPASWPYFELPPDEILPTCIENLAAYLWAAEEKTIPELRDLDSDGDGVLDEDDYCPNSPGEEVDELGCTAEEQDVDEDGVLNTLDACRNTPPGQQVGADGCRVPALFTLSVSSNADAIDIEVSPADIDARTGGNTGSEGFTRDYAEPTDLVLTAPQMFNGSLFSVWEVEGERQPAGQTSILLTTAEDAEAHAIYRVPTSLDIIGLTRIPDRRPGGTAYQTEYTLQLTYDDNSVSEVTEGIVWSIEDDSVAGIDEEGTLLAFSVPSSVGEVITEIDATATLGDLVLEAEPFELRVFDPDTRDPWCDGITLEGVEELSAGGQTQFTATVSLQGYVDPAVNPDMLEWELMLEDGSTPADLPASISAGGVVTAGRPTEDTDIYVRAIYPNDSGTVCYADAPLRVSRSSGGTASGAGSCGALGPAALIGMGLGLVGLRRRRT
jgi:carboxypeptidase T